MSVPKDGSTVKGFSSLLHFLYHPRMIDGSDTRTYLATQEKYSASLGITLKVEGRESLNT